MLWAARLWKIEGEHAVPPAVHDPVLFSSPDASLRHMTQMPACRDATRSGLISAFLKAGENLETRITKYHRYIDQQLLDKLQRRIDTAEL